MMLFIHIYFDYWETRSRMSSLSIEGNWSLIIKLRGLVLQGIMIPPREIPWIWQRFGDLPHLNIINDMVLF